MMIAQAIRRLRAPLLAVGLVALTLATTSGATHLGSLYLGHANDAAAPTTLTGNLASPVLKAVNQGNAAALRGDAQNGIGVNGVSVSGTGQQGESQSGIGIAGTHKATTGASPGVQGSTASTDPLGAGVLGRNTGGGPGVRAIVNAGAPPLAVNSNVKVANLNADLLDGLDATGFWKAGGNVGTVPGTDFIGTTDNQALELKVNGQRALRIEPVVLSPNMIAGSSHNSVVLGLAGATIAGGGSSIDPNRVNNTYGTVAGGSNNAAGGYASTVSGGEGNTAGGNVSVVGSGSNNLSAGTASMVSGGAGNTASGGYSAVPGGVSNTASGDNSFAAGRRAKANHQGAFVWGDSTDADFASTANDQFLVRASGGAKVVRGTSSFHGTGAALQVEHAGTDGEAGWLRIVSASSVAPVLNLLKHPAGSGSFLTCMDFDGTSATPKCHISPVGTFVGGSDFAESLPARGGKVGYEPGDVLVASRPHPGEVERSHKRFDRALIGVYSTRPAVLGADKGGVTRVGRNEIPVAIAGIVPVKVTAENGRIRPGDLLTSSSLRGRAMKAGRNPAVGTVLGKSLGAFERGRGMIRALVMLR